MGNCQTDCVKSTGIINTDKEKLVSKSDLMKKRFSNIIKEKDESPISSPNDQAEKRIIEYDNGKYDGEYDDIKKRQGFGTYKWLDGSIYYGNWNDDKMSGYGKLQYANGDIYEGNWLDNKADGYGELTQKQGSVYKGMWINDLKEGKGTETWENMAKYEGDYSNGMKNGFGKLTLKDGSYYHVS